MPYKIFTPGWVMHNPQGTPAVGEMWRNDWRSFWLTDDNPQKVSKPQQRLSATESLIDAFATTVDKSILMWPSTSVQVVWDASGQAKIPCTSSYYTLGSATQYDLTSSYFYAKVTPATGGTGTRETFLSVLLDANNKVEVYVSGATLGCRKVVASSVTTVNTATYNATTHAWWRIRELAGTIYFDYSTDGTTWVNFGTTTVTWTLSPVWMQVAVGYYGTESAADAFVDNVNTLGVAARSGRPKMWNGSTWAQKPLKVWTGSVWKECPVKVWDGTQWKTLA